MGQRLRLGVIGCGDIAGYTALFARLNPRITLAACCDVNPRRAQAFAARWRIPRVTTDRAELLAETALDAVYVAVPHHLHAEILAEAMQAGKAVFIEKPVTRTLAEGWQMARLAEEQGARVAVNYQYRYDTGCYALARAAQRGALGAVRYARVNVPWQRSADYFEASPWHASLAQAGGGTLITQGSHFLDVALWACGGQAVAATGVTARRAFAGVEVEDLALGIVELDNGALIEICSSMAAASEQAARIEIYGSQGTAIYTNRPWPRVTFRGARVRPARPPTPGLHALQRSLEGFRRWAVGGPPPLVTLTDALAVLGVVEAIYRSAASGKQEHVESRSAVPQPR